jgi:two-component system chemotaxis response regulator CheB
MKKIRVLVVEDSTLMRRIIGDIISEQPDMEVVATAGNGLEALAKIETAQPQVITMDLEMPRMGGLDTLRKIMALNPLPVIMVSSYTQEGSEATMKALSAGAVDFIAKPVMASVEDTMAELRAILPDKIRAAASARTEMIVTSSPFQPPAPKRTVERPEQAARVVVAIGASTGGPKALETIFSAFPADLPAAVLLCLHMPPGFTMTFANRLDSLSRLQVQEAFEGAPLLEGQALVAPGGYHIKLRGDKIVLDAGPKVNFVRPSVDVMFESLCDYPRPVIAVILTGMGRDGAAGAARLKQSKEDTVILVQDPATAVIPSMPEAVMQQAACSAVVPLKDMAAEITRHVLCLSREGQ